MLSFEFCKNFKNIFWHNSSWWLILCFEIFPQTRILRRSFISKYVGYRFFGIYLGITMRNISSMWVFSCLRTLVKKSSEKIMFEKLPFSILNIRLTCFWTLPALGSFFVICFHRPHSIIEAFQRKFGLSQLLNKSKKIEQLTLSRLGVPMNTFYLEAAN